jgi:integrase
VSPKSHERYGEIVRHYLMPAFGNLQLAKLAPVHIQDAYNALATGGRRDGKEGGLSPRTRRHIHRILSAALSRAVEQQLIARNPADAFKKRLPKVERREMATLTTHQAQALLAAIRHVRVYWPVLIALGTGARRGEILALRWRNVDLDRGSLCIVESLEQTKAGLRFKAPKNEKTRAITLPAFAVAELRRLKREQAESLLMLGVRQSSATLLCARADGEPMPPRSLTHEFLKAIRRVEGVPRVRFHDLRHSHATHLLVAGVHPKVAQARSFIDQRDARPLQPRDRDHAGRCRGKARHGVSICYKRPREMSASVQALCGVNGLQSGASVANSVASGAARSLTH